MQVGDIVEWRAMNVNLRGKVVTNNSSIGGGYLVQLENGKTFSLDDLRFSKSFRIVSHDLHRH